MLSETRPREIEVPDDHVSAQAADALAALTAFLRSHPTPSPHVRLVSEDSASQATPVVVPAVAFRFFIQILDELAKGNAVTVAPIHAELTSQQAADLLNVSRPYLIKLLDGRKIPYRRVGNRRRILLSDLMDYKRRSEELRREIARELTRDAQDMGLGY